MDSLTGSTATIPVFTRHTGSLRTAVLAESLQARDLCDSFQLEDSLICALMQRRACTGNCHMISGNSFTGLTTRSSTCALSCAQLRACTFAHSASSSITILHPMRFLLPRSSQHYLTKPQPTKNKYKSPWRTSTHSVQAPTYPATHNTPTISCRLS